jgi:aldose 1-epimerase
MTKKLLQLAAGAAFAAALISTPGCALFSGDSAEQTVAVQPVASAPWGKLPDGREASIYTLDNGKGLRVRISNYGALLVGIEVPDKEGKLADVALGYNNLDAYFSDAGTHDSAKSDTYFGAVVGRVANRIAGGRFSLNGKTYSLATNNSPADIPCSLHGGKEGLDRKLWTAAPLTGGAYGLELRYTSPDGEEGYPGKLDIVVTYALLHDPETKSNTLRVTYSAGTDKATPVNLSQHSYFNLAGEGVGTILDHELKINASSITPVTAGLIPTGDLLPVKGTPFDFTSFHKIGERINEQNEQLQFGNGYDHNWVLNGCSAGRLGVAAQVYEPTSGRLLTIKTTEPGLQFYSGNFLKGNIRGKSGKTYGLRGGLALETQHFPDSPNQPKFPSIILKPGERYETTTEYVFSVK